MIENGIKRAVGIFGAASMAFTLLVGCGHEPESSAAVASEISVYDDVSVPDVASVPNLETVPDAASVPDLETASDAASVPNLETVPDLETTSDVMSKAESESEPESMDEEQTVEYGSMHEIPAGSTPDINPLKGLIAYAEDTSFPQSMEWFYIGVNEVETAEGVYDWTALEKRLEPIAERGHQAVFRFYYDYPGEDSGVPQYLTDKYGLEMKPYNEPRRLGGAGLSPDYSNVYFRQSMQNFIAAFGKEYDGDPRIGFITEGLLGFWGEWHNWPYDEEDSEEGDRWKIPTEVYAEVYNSFDKAFDVTALLVREPKKGVDNVSFKTGYHDDSFAYETLSSDNGGNEWGFMQRLKDQGVQNAWQSGCIGGEVYPSIQDKVFKDFSIPFLGEHVQDWDRCVKETHASWLICDRIKRYQGKERENAINASKGLGYDLQVTRAFYSDTVGKDMPLSVMVEIKNNGVAPFYYDHRTWPVVIGVIKDNELVNSWETNWDLPNVRADQKAVMFRTTIDRHELEEGTCILCIKVKNPLEEGCDFHFANRDELSGGWLSLGTFEIK